MYLNQKNAIYAKPRLWNKQINIPSNMLINLNHIYNIFSWTITNVFILPKLWCILMCFVFVYIEYPCMIKLMKKRGKNGAKSEKNGLKIIQEAQSDTTVPRNIYAHIYAPFISWYAPKRYYGMKLQKGWDFATFHTAVCTFGHTACGPIFWHEKRRNFSLRRKFRPFGHLWVL